MKKFISILLSFTFIFSAVSVSLTTYAEEFIEEKAINNFIDGIVELSHEYDADKDFVVVDDTSANSATINQFYSNGEATESVEVNILDFQTARLIVRADEKFNDCGALEHISGFDNFHILQYKNVETAQNAYEFLLNNSKIISVWPDEIVKPIKSDNNLYVNGPTDNESLNEWCHDRTQTDRLLDFIKLNNIQLNEVVVGVIDSGIDYKHEFLKERIIRTYFNSSNDGTEHDELDALDPEYSHGTATSSIIIDNSPNNVKVAVYRVINETDGTATVSQICAGYLKAIEDCVDVINVSLGYDDDSGLTEECVEKAYNKNIPFIVAAGNDAAYFKNYPAICEKCITVSSTNKDNFISDFATMVKTVDVSAPGEDVRVAIPGDLYGIWSGTSFSTPCVTALCAILKSYKTEITVKIIENTLINTALPVNERSVTNIDEDNYWLDGFNNGLSGKGLVQFCDAFGLNELSIPSSNLETTCYIDSQICKFSCEDQNAIILYTTNGTYPDLNNGKEYIEPFEITNLTQLRIVSYYPNYDYYSQTIEIVPNIFYADKDEMFVINDNGIITEYKGTISNLKVPDVINNILVSGFESGTFSDATITGLYLPNGVKTIPSKAFYNNESIYYIQGDGVETVEQSAFDHAINLFHAIFPNLKTVGISSFNNSSLIEANYPLLESVDYASFASTKIYEFYGENVKSINRLSFGRCQNLSTVSLPECIEAKYAISATSTSGSFYGCTSLCKVYMPKIEILNKGCFRSCPLDEVDLPSLKKIYTNVFTDCDVSKAEFSVLETANSLPIIQNSIIALPSTFKECTEDTIGRNYIIYGTSGTYAEQWAKDNEHTFIEISQDTAILEDVPAEYYGLGEIISPYIIGFNKTYQWYSNTEANNTTGTPIKGATSKDFNPADYESAPYYYCVVTSTDKDCPSVEVRTGVTMNTVFSDKETLLSPMSSQIRFNTNADGSYANIFDVRTRAMITDEDFKEYIADTNEEAELVISKVGFVYARGSVDFSVDDAEKVAQGEIVEGYVDAPVSYIQDADGYYMFTCLVTNIPTKDMPENLTAFAYICVNDTWYFFDTEVTADFNLLHSTYYPQAAEKYGWTV